MQKRSNMETIDGDAACAGTHATVAQWRIKFIASLPTDGAIEHANQSGVLIGSVNATAMLPPSIDTPMSMDTCHSSSGNGLRRKTAQVHDKFATIAITNRSPNQRGSSRSQPTGGDHSFVSNTNVVAEPRPRAPSTPNRHSHNGPLAPANKTLRPSTFSL